MGVDTDNWSDFRRSLMDVHGFAPHSLHCRPQDSPTLRRSSSLDSILSLCSTTFSSSEEEPAHPSDHHETALLPEVPEEDEEEDWRMFGWLLDSAEASSPEVFGCCSRLDRKTSSSSFSTTTPPLSPLSPLTVQVEPMHLRTSDDLVTTTTTTAATPRPPPVSRPWWKGMPMTTFGCHSPKIAADAGGERKRAASTDLDSDGEEEEEEEFEDRRVTRAMAHYLEIKRSRHTRAPMTEDCMSIPESIPEPIPIPAAAVPNHASYYAQNEAMETDYHQLHHHHHHQHQQQQQPMLPPAPEDELELDDDSMDVKTDIRHSPRQAIRPHKYTSPTDMTLAVSTSTQKPKMIQSMRPCGVAIIPAKHGKDLKKNKPGRPSNKERRRMERKAAAELRKMAKKGPANHPTDEIDVNACHCLCRAPFDMKKFYLACSTCFCWFHGKCVGVTEKRASKMPSWQCPQCAPETARYIPPPAKRPKLEPFSDAPEEFEEEDPNALYCVCQTVYDTNAYYVGCDGCSNWFHPDCVGITIQEAEAMQSYICPSCRTTKTECPAESSQDAAPLSEPESNAIFTAVKTMLEQEGAHLFTNGHSECAQYSNACPNCDTLDELMDKFRRGSYANVRTFLDDIDMMQATVENAFGPASDHTLTMTNLVHVAKAVLDDHLTSS